MKILFSSAECVPFFKVGGLADVAEALPKAIKKKNNDIRVVLPFYKQMPVEFKTLCEDVLYFYIEVGWRHQYCGIKKLEFEGIIYYFIDNEFYFNRDSIYGYGDDGERFSFFQLAIIEMMEKIDFIPDIVHVNDYHTAMIPFLLREKYNYNWKFHSIYTVLTIHNIEFQGYFNQSILPDFFGLDERYFYNGSVRFQDCVNFLKTGIVYADRIVTVSPTYAKEIQTQEFGFGLDGILRMRSWDVTGILNGINYEINNPETDPVIPHHFSIANLDGKQRNKEELQERMGLPIRDVPLISMVSRLTHQKGCQLILDELRYLLEEDVQVIILGTGDYNFEEGFRYFATQNPSKCSVSISFDSNLAQLFYAGSDMFLMPSSFEPCGLAQMISMRYGTIPVVHEIGGLKDTVVPYNVFTGQGTGFGFSEFSSFYFMHALQEAISLFNTNRREWDKVVHNAMTSVFDWNLSSNQYIDLYRSLI